jgi:hypothetical protein
MKAMPLNNNLQLKKQLNNLGFGSITDEVDSKAGHKKFIVNYNDKMGDDALQYVLQFEKVENKTILARYGLTIQSIVIPKVLIKGIDTAELESRIIKADDLCNNYYSSGKAVTIAENKIIASRNRDLHLLIDTGGTGREISKLLIFKYWPGIFSREIIPDAEKLKENYQVEIQVGYNKDKILTAFEAYNEAKKYYHIPKIEGMAEAHVLSDSLFEQAQFEISFGRDWVAYNTIPYFLDKGDATFF